MKKYNYVNKCLIAFLLLASFTGCKKEELSYTGNLKISFVNHPSDLVISIFSIDNSQIPIFNELNTDSNGGLEKELNIGNYFVKCYSASASYDVLGFQIKSGETTSLYYDLNNWGHQQK